MKPLGTAAMNTSNRGSATVDPNSLRSAPSQLWSRLEAFAHRVHGSLDPTEVAYIVANEGRCLVGCDRLSVGIGASRGLRIEAVSGVDVVDRHSNLVRQMRRLCDRVRAWGELLAYTGSKDEALPADVFAALDAYLAQSPSKVLVVLPLVNGRAGSSDQQSVLVMESFEPSQSSAELIARLEVVVRDAAQALYNAQEYARIPLRRLWVFLIKARTGACLAGVLMAALLAVLGWAPYALKLDAEGHLVPAERRWLYSPLEAQVVDFADAARPGASVSAGQALVLMYDAQLEIKLVELEQDIAGARRRSSRSPGRSWRPSATQSGSDSAPKSSSASLLASARPRSARRSSSESTLTRHGQDISGCPRQSQAPC